MTNYDYLIDQLRSYTASDYYKPYKEAADAIEALVKERGQNDINYSLEKADHERTKEELAALRKQIDELEAVAYRVALLT